MTTTSLQSERSAAMAPRPATVDRSVRSPRDDLAALPSVLRSEWIKLASVRVNRVVLALAVVIAGLAAWAVATAVTDEVLTVSQVFVFPTLLVAVLAAVAGILIFTSEAQHGTLASAVTAQPSRSVLAAGKTVMAVGFGLALGVAGSVAGAAGAALAGLETGDVSAMAVTFGYALLYTSLAGMFGLGIGMIVRHGAGAISGLLVWWFVAENLILAFAPATVARFLPFDAGYRMLGVGSDFDSPEMIAAALTRPQYALVFAGCSVLAAFIGAALFVRRDVN
jgi:ABC-2 type transport system permease protein